MDSRSIKFIGYLCEKFQIMGMPRFFKVPRHKQFHYEPFYYDERKEKLEERIKQIEMEHGIEGEIERSRTITKGSFSHYFDRKKKTQGYSATRLILITIFLLFVSYFLFFS